ncbi:MAG: T9SS type A sorting domain-containing protein [Bacteroidia bacterium]|nr:T9SS type A sorting domain-containing protein [Bacteroidia bacterium]
MNLRLLILFLLFPLLTKAQTTLNQGLRHNGINRTYILYIPASYSDQEAVPLLFNFHGYTSNANAQMVYGDFRSISDTAGFIIVHPQGTLDAEGKTHFNVGWGGSNTDDVGFTDLLLDSLLANYNIDESRVYSTGMSNGGYMSYYLACQLGDRIAAVASVTGSMTPLQYNGCSPTHPTPVLQIHGTQDNVVPINGANWTRSIDDVIQYWVTHNNCDETPEISALPNTNATDQSTVEHIVYKNGDNGVQTEYFKVTGGRHTWPGSAIPSTGTNYDIDASEEVWKFFSRYDINGLRSTTSSKELNPYQVNIYPNPASTFLLITTDHAGTKSYQLLDVLGKEKFSGSFSTNSFQINLSALTKGLYFLKIGKQYYKILKEN